MDNVRNGMYIRYKNYELKIVETRVEVPIPIEQKKYQILYEDGSNCPFDDFVKSNHDNGYYKILKIDKLNDVFGVRTFGKYNGFPVEIFKTNKDGFFMIATRDSSIADELKFNSTNENWYTKEILNSKLELIWEEITRIKQTNEKYGDIIRLNELIFKNVN